MKDLSRAEVGVAIRKEAANLMLGTSLLFLAAGSVWTHFALGAVFVEPTFFAAWALINLNGFLSLKFQRLENVFVGVSLLALQLYFHTALKQLQIPYLPLAPIFFLVSSLALTAYTRGSLLRFCSAWGVSWLSSVLWIRTIESPEAPLNTAVIFAFALNTLFFVIFFVAIRFSVGRMASSSNALGARQNYDEQRLHAAKLQTLGELAAGLSHEINNPLSAINGYSHQIRGELLEAQPPSVEILTAANDRIKFNVDRIIEITKALRTFSRAEGGEAFVPVSLAEVIEDSLVLTRSSFKTEKVELQVEIPADGARTLGNFVQLSQLLVNLLTNARDACALSERKKVTVGFALRGEQVVLWVQDTGPGIGENIRANIFRAFFTTKDARKGTGLGLYISQIIAERHHATLSFSCPKDPHGRVLGTRFEIVLPKALPAAATGAAAA